MTPPKRPAVAQRRQPFRPPAPDPRATGRSRPSACCARCAPIRCSSGPPRITNCRSSPGRRCSATCRSSTIRRRSATCSSTMPPIIARTNCNCACSAPAWGAVFSRPRETPGARSAALWRRSSLPASWIVSSPPMQASARLAYRPMETPARRPPHGCRGRILARDARRSRTHHLPRRTRRRTLEIHRSGSRAISTRRDASNPSTSWAFPTGFRASAVAGRRPRSPSSRRRSKP